METREQKLTLPRLTSAHVLHFSDLLLLPYLDGGRGLSWSKLERCCRWQGEAGRAMAKAAQQASGEKKERANACCLLLSEIVTC